MSAAGDFECPISSPPSVSVTPVDLLKEYFIANSGPQSDRQLVSTGNLDITDWVVLFLTDYPHRTRLKLLGHARMLDAREHPELVDQLVPESLRSKVQRLFLIQVNSYDWNCPQYITPRFTAAEVANYIAPLKARIAELEAQLAASTTPRVCLRNRASSSRGVVFRLTRRWKEVHYGQFLRITVERMGVKGENRSSRSRREIRRRYSSYR
jgi:hypothetical protein